ncbi:MAG TPA: ribosome maturation factor RimP [Candidatus Acidoferrales bacterium]|nr:ribosome maturation factor RimP [Candidatus Acidoferrales bacterium]
MKIEKIREVAERVAGASGLEVVDVEWKVGRQRFLRVVLDKPGGVNHGDCEKVSQELGVILDVEELIPGQAGYVLEVSSPGLDRKLTKPAEFERFAGRRAKISLSQPVENVTFFEGRLAGYKDGRVQLEANGRVVELPFEWIRKAQLVVEL